MNELPENYVPVLDKGYVGLVDFMGHDWRPADAARVSFAKRADEFTDEQNTRLLNYLLRNKEYSCFRHNVFTFELRMPLMTARQFWKYVVSSNFTEDQLAWNENSRRYITDDNEFYTPTEWRNAPDNKKQGSGELTHPDRATIWARTLERYQKQGEALYQNAVEENVAPELARLFLPAYGLYVTCMWTVSLNAVMHMLDERLGHTAQLEIVEYARGVKNLVETQLPNIMKAWESNR